jgi:hypothetical protein
VRHTGSVLDVDNNLDKDAYGLVGIFELVNYGYVIDFAMN